MIDSNADHSDRDVFPPPIHTVPTIDAAPVITPEVARVLALLASDEEEALYGS